MESISELKQLAAREKLSVLYMKHKDGHRIIVVTPNHDNPVDALLTLSLEILKELEGVKPCLPTAQ